MRLRPRHYALIAILCSVFLYQMVRRRSAQPVVTGPSTRVPAGPPPQTPAWTAFDHAAQLREAPDVQFQPALQALRQQIQTQPAEPEISGCVTWLEFYRQGVLHPSVDPQWRQRSQRHLDGCVRFHADTSV